MGVAGLREFELHQRVNSGSYGDVPEEPMETDVSILLEVGGCC